MGFSHVLPFPPTGKVDRVGYNGVIVRKVKTIKLVHIDS